MYFVSHVQCQETFHPVEFRAQNILKGHSVSLTWLKCKNGLQTVLISCLDESIQIMRSNSSLILLLDKKLALREGKEALGEGR